MFRPRTNEEAHAPAIARGAQCRECSLWACERGPVMGEVRPNSRLLVIGEAPGTREVQEGRPFTGPSGVELDQSLAHGGLARSECTITNVILCQPPEDFDDYLERLNREHKKRVEVATDKGEALPERRLTPVEACAPRLMRDVQEAASSTFLAVGGKALRACAQHFNVAYGLSKDTVGQVGVATIKAQHGSPIRMPDNRILTSSLHPAFAMRNNRQYTQVIRDNIARAARIVQRGNIIDWQEPKGAYYDHWNDEHAAISSIEAMCDRFVQNAAKARLAVDIETDTISVKSCLIRCVGMGMTVESVEHIICVPFYWRDGRSFWSNRTYRERAEHAVRRVIDTCHLTFHNGIFDTAVLLNRGLMSDPNKIWFDTMLAHKDSDSNDLPHDLGFVVRQYTEAPLWKHDVDHKAAAGVASDRDLHIYNLRDVGGTMRIQPPLEQRVVECGNVEQFRLDAALAPIARDMGRLGLFIDERERGELSYKLNKLTKGLCAQFQATVGYDLNPRSPVQIKKWLYDDRGYQPALNTEGYEWEEGDDASSSTPALLKLLDLGVDGNTEEAINTLIEYRACEKLRGSYVDNLRVVYDWDDADKMTSLDAVSVDGFETLPKRPELSWMPVGWKIHVIPSGRWVCEPTIQNWPARGWMVDGKPTNMRRMIVAPPGHVLVGADYEQIELRIYGVVANDQYVLRAFREGLEPHCLNAATIMAPREEDIMPLYEEFVRKHKSGTKEEKSEMKYIRTVAKRVAYLKNYGGEEDKLFSAMSSERDKATGKRVFPNLDPSRVSEWEERWEKRHPETKQWHRRVANKVRQLGYVETPILTHRKRYFVGGPNKKNAPPNHEIQGAAAEIANQATIRIAREIPFGGWSKYSGLCLQVHDYLGVFVPEDKAEKAKEILERCMYHEMACDDGWMMPFPAEAIVSRNLADNA